MIYVGLLVSSGYLMTFTSDSWKATKGSMVVTHDKKKNTLCLTNNANGFIVVVETCVNLDTWHCRPTKHISEKEMKILHSTDKQPGLKSLDLEL